MYYHGKKELSISERSNDRIYYNISIPGKFFNIPSSNTFNIIPAIYQEQLNQSIIENPRDFYMSIVRFTIPTQSIPIFIFVPQPFPNMNQNLGIYSVTLEYNGVFSPQTFFTYFSTTPNIDSPMKPTATNIFWSRTPYYYVYNYNTFLKMMNNALAIAFAALPGAPPTVAPFLTYDPASQLLAVVAPKAFYDLALPIPVKIYFNSPLQRFFGGIPYIFYSINDPLGRDSQFLIQDLKNNTYLLPNATLLPPPEPITYLIMYQNYNTLSDWNSFKTLQIVTNLIPIKNEYTPSSQNLQNTSGIVNLLGIVTDFEPILQNGAESRTSIQFQLTGPYRLINLTDLNPLTKMDISVFWTDELLNRYLLYVPEGELLTMKIVFIKKSTFEGY